MRSAPADRISDTQKQGATTMKILRKTLLAGLVLPVLFAAGAAMAGEVTLLFWPGPESEAMQKVVDAYNDGPGKADGITVKQLLFSRQGYFEKELADLAAGSSEFDVALVTTYTLGRYAPYLDPVDAQVPAAARAEFAPVALDSLTLDGKLYGSPPPCSSVPPTMPRARPASAPCCR
jgi:multiple sugar transport system substrate-binding protein